eukprot:TRINITY_DN50817_c0_g1_i1.p1 TRINITY_DN50817_c0_g1~~TRINITY_DN50817_c0_g1_i1.p1  ORF type:complete len:115 (+),score=7.37 TRINITY_DN50817_c0_g1_i1:174-518(+)
MNPSLQMMVGSLRFLILAWSYHVLETFWGLLTAFVEVFVGGCDLRVAFHSQPHVVAVKQVVLRHEVEDLNSKRSRDFSKSFPPSKIHVWEDISAVEASSVCPGRSSSGRLWLPV